MPRVWPIVLLALTLGCHKAPPADLAPPEDAGAALAVKVTARPEPSLLFPGKALPEPPRQKEPWTPPPTRLLTREVAAAKPLFAQGLADPRGCAYREVTVATGSCWTGDAGRVTTHGWVLPGPPRDGWHFCVCWNGLLYPAAAVGGPADLRADVRAAAERRRQQSWNTARDAGPGHHEGRSVWYGSLGTQGVCLLLRLGEGALADELVEAGRAGMEALRQQAAAPRPGQPQVTILAVARQGDEPDPYPGVADAWCWSLFDRGLGAHMRGDDAVALHDFRLLAAASPAVEAEAARRGFRPQKAGGGGRLLGYLGQLPALLADQERRARRGERAPVVCAGPGRDPDPAKRIAALIDRLDEVSARQIGQPGGVDLGGDPVVQALVREGEPAIGPLLACFERDRRLTRSVHFWRDFDRSRTVLAVREAAHVALSALLHTDDFHPAATGDNLTSRGEGVFRDLAAKARAARQANARASEAERGFATLADNHAGPRQWLQVSSVLLQPDDVAVAPGTTVYAARAVRLRRRADGPPRLKGEPLRARRNPSVADLLHRRVGQTADAADAAGLALALFQWEGKGALPVLAEQTKRCRAADAWQPFIRLVEARAQAGDPAGLDDYVAWVRTTTPRLLEGGAEGWQVFQTMWLYADHPGMAQAAEWLFNAPRSPWLPLLRRWDEDRAARAVFGLTGTSLLGMAGFRKAVLRELGRRAPAGSAHLGEEGGLSIQPPDYVSSHQPGVWDPQFPRGAAAEFRVCDYFAWAIAHAVDAAPRCELYWPERRRDDAVAACAAFLRLYGDRVGPWMTFPALDRPATPEDVGAGRAIFSLEGQGPVRLVRLPERPLDARWRTLKDHPVKQQSYDPGTGERSVVTGYQQDGRVSQAEEVFRGGRWQRFYGFVGAHRVARVPASQIEFPPADRWPPGRRWLRLGPTLSGRLEGPAPPEGPDEDEVPRLPAAAPVRVALLVHNHSGLDQSVPRPEVLVRLTLRHSPETISRQGRLAPKAVRDADWAPLAARPGARWEEVPGDPLTPAGQRTAGHTDLRAWFPLDRPGFYRLRLTPADASVPAEELTAIEVQFSLAPGAAAARGRP